MKSSAREVFSLLHRATSPALARKVGRLLHWAAFVVHLLISHLPSPITTKAKRPLVVIVIPRGEAVRNFLYSDTLRLLGEQARVVVLSVVTNEAILAKARPFVEEIIPIEEHPWPRKRRMVQLCSVVVAIFEEVSTIHVIGDSYYEDENISRMDPVQRKTVLTGW